MEHTEKGPGQLLSQNDLHPLGLALSWQQIYSITVIPSDVLECHVCSLKSALVGVFTLREMASTVNQGFIWFIECLLIVCTEMKLHLSKHG